MTLNIVRLIVICSMFCVSFLLTGCLEDYCDPNQDEGYCDGDVAMTCVSNPEGASHIWSRGECVKKRSQPYCVVGQATVNGKVQKYASCSSIPEVKKECYEKGRTALMFCIDGKKAICSDVGGAVLSKDEDC